MKSGESVSDFFARTMTVANKMRIHGEKMEDIVIIEKILRSMTPKFNFMVCSIEEPNDIDELSIDELHSSLLVHEKKVNQQDKEEQALNVSFESHSRRSDRGRGRGRSRGRRDYGRQQSYHHQQENQFRERGRGFHHSTGQRPISAYKANIECYKCHKYGHYQSDCRSNVPRQSEERNNFAEKEEEVSLLMVCHTNEETKKNMWYLDTGCSNHMCGDENAFFELDESIRNTVKFGH